MSKLKELDCVKLDYSYIYTEAADMENEMNRLIQRYNDALADGDIEWAKSILEDIQDLQKDHAEFCLMVEARFEQEAG